jgi:hypothetical protein
MYIINEEHTWYSISIILSWSYTVYHLKANPEFLQTKSFPELASAWRGTRTERAGAPVRKMKFPLVLYWSLLYLPV